MIPETQKVTIALVRCFDASRIQSVSAVALPAVLDAEEKPGGAESGTRLERHGVIGVGAGGQGAHRGRFGIAALELPRSADGLLDGRACLGRSGCGRDCGGR